MNHIVIGMVAMVACCCTAVASGQSRPDSLPPQPKVLRQLEDLQERVMSRVVASRNPKSAGKFKVIFMPPPFDNIPDYGFNIGAGVSGIFKTGSDPLLYTSSIPLSARFGFTDPFSFNVKCSPTLYFCGNRLKLSALAMYQQRYEHYFGIGYSTNISMARDRAVNGYQSCLWRVSPEVSVRVGRGDVYVGVVADYRHETMLRPGDFLLSDGGFAAIGGDAGRAKLVDVGAGVDFTIDTRDVAYGPEEGVLLNARAMYYAKCLGGDFNYGKLTLDYRHYMRLWGRENVLSWGISSYNAVGRDIPFARYATIGDGYVTRGYYGYQFRDKSVLKAHVEYRYMFNFNTLVGQLLVNRFGVAGWGGIALLGENVVRYDAALPEIGVGLRMKAAPRVNARFDVGYGTATGKVLYYFGITELF